MNRKRTIKERFDLTGKTAFITGGGGLLGEMHAEAIAEAGGTPILADITLDKAQAIAERLKKEYAVKAHAIVVDITDKRSIEKAVTAVIKDFGAIHILINNAANNPQVSSSKDMKNFSRLENFPLEQWNADIAVGLTGAFLCAQIIGTHMAQHKGGVIINISSDLGIIAPDQRLYAQQGIPADHQNVKPVTYSVVKHALIGLTKYLSTYWPTQNVRANTLSPGGVFNDQNKDFLEQVHSRIPMGRMAERDEYKGAIVFLASDASSYMNGANLVIDGGRTAW